MAATIVDTEKTGFYVDFKKDCPHHASALKENIVVDSTDPCQTCGNKGENWLCLSCSGVYCSRYVKEHMVAHNQTSNHPITFSYSDASVWCYSCNAYIDLPALRAISNALTISKTKWNVWMETVLTFWLNICIVSMQ